MFSTRRRRWYHAGLHASVRGARLAEASHLSVRHLGAHFSPEEMLTPGHGRVARLLARARRARKGLAAGASLDGTTQAMLLRQLYLSLFEERDFQRALEVATQALELGVMADVLRQDAARAALARGRSRRGRRPPARRRKVRPRVSRRALPPLDAREHPLSGSTVRGRGGGADAGGALGDTRQNRCHERTSRSCESLRARR